MKDVHVELDGCVNLGPLRTRCQNEVKHVIILLREIPWENNRERVREGWESHQTTI